MSRDHRGWSTSCTSAAVRTGSFYYYVMELGDDVRTGREINPIEYEPRTLRADNTSDRRQWDRAYASMSGLRLAEALGHLHEHGLAHRDVKPSNVIFVNGRAKLADIGLVARAASGHSWAPRASCRRKGRARRRPMSTAWARCSMKSPPARTGWISRVAGRFAGGADRKRWLELNQHHLRHLRAAGFQTEDLHRGRTGRRAAPPSTRQTPPSAAAWRFGRHRAGAGFFGWAVGRRSRTATGLMRLEPLPIAGPPRPGMLLVVSTPEGPTCSMPMANRWAPRRPNPVPGRRQVVSR